MTVSLRAMRYFLAAARLGNISKAADELHVASSALAAAIDSVENGFRLKLVTRQRSRGIQLTAAGRAMIHKIEALVESYDRLLEEGAEMQERLTGLLSIGYYAPIAPAFLPAIVNPMLTGNPGLTLRLEECDNDHAQAGLLDGSYDAILFVANIVHPLVGFHKLIDAPAYCLCAARHPFAARASVSLAEMADGPLIILNRPVATPYYTDLLETTGKPLNIAAYANSTEMVRSLVGAGFGCAILNMRPHADRSYAGDALAAIPISDATASLPLAVGYLHDTPRRVVSIFTDRCRAHFKSDAGKRLIVSS